MQERVRIDISSSTELCGSERYILTIEIVNLSDRPLFDIKVRPLVIPGQPISFTEDFSYKETSKREYEYEYESQKILAELNLQIIEAYSLIQETHAKTSNQESLDRDSLGQPKLKQGWIGIPFLLRFNYSIPQKRGSFYKYKNRSYFSNLLNEIHHLLTTPAQFDSIEFPFYGRIPFPDNSELQKIIDVPVWGEEALKISTWEDVERAEDLFINNLPANSLLKKLFLLNKEKLRALNSEIGNESLKDLRRKIDLRPAQIINYSFCCQAPFLWHARKIDTQFEISYLEKGEEGDDNIVGIKSIRKTLIFRASNISIPFGVLSGGFCGFLVRSIFLTPNFLELFREDVLDNFIVPSFGTILLSLILATVVSRSKESTKFITVEDFSGGFFIGSITGLFNREILDYLKTVLPFSESDSELS